MCIRDSANSATAPGIVDADRNPVLTRSEVYSGVYGLSLIHIYMTYLHLFLLCRIVLLNTICYIHGQCGGNSIPYSKFYISFRTRNCLLYTSRRASG